MRWGLVWWLSFDRAGVLLLRMNVAGQSALAIAISLARRDGAGIGPELTLVVQHEPPPPSLKLFPQMHWLAGALRLNWESDSVSRYRRMLSPNLCGANLNG